MNDIASGRVGPMQNPPRLGELIRECMDDAGWKVTETAARLGCERGTLSRLLNGNAGVSAKMALALEDVGWGTAEHWMLMQASYEVAQTRRERIVAGRRAGALHACSSLAPSLPERTLSNLLRLARFGQPKRRPVGSAMWVTWLDALVAGRTARSVRVATSPLYGPTQ